MATCSVRLHWEVPIPVVLHAGVTTHCAIRLNVVKWNQNGLNSGLGMEQTHVWGHPSGW